MIKSITLFFASLFISFNLLISDGIKDPEIAKKLSFIPGAGQFYNEDYLKGLFFLSSEIYSVSMIDKFAYNITKRNSFIWWAIGLYILNVLDAYIDAELSSFPDEENILTK